MNRYDTKTVSAIIKIVRESHARGLDLNETFTAVQKAGYKGDKVWIGNLLKQNSGKPADIKPSGDDSTRTLASVTKHAFDANVLARGERYFYEQTVKIAGGGRSQIKAKVTGSRVYDVSLDLVEDELIVDCDCPHFMDGALCKHLWATILASDANRRLNPSAEYSEFLVTRADDIDDDDDDFQEKPAVWRQPNIDRVHDYRSQPPIPAWKLVLDNLWRDEKSSRYLINAPDSVKIEFLYVVDVPLTMKSDGLAVEVQRRHRKHDGSLGQPKPCAISRSEAGKIPDPRDRQILSTLTGASFGTYSFEGQSSKFLIPAALQETLIPLLAGSGRFYLRKYANEQPILLQLDEGPPWEFRLKVTRPVKTDYLVEGALQRGDEHRNLIDAALLMPGGWVFWPDRIARLNSAQSFHWIDMLRKERELRVPVEQGSELLTQICRFERLPQLELPEELRFEQANGTPRPRLTLKKPTTSFSIEKTCAELAFDYEGSVFPAIPRTRTVFLADRRRMLVRDQDAESTATERLRQLGFRYGRYSDDRIVEIDTRKIPAVVRTLISENWNVDAEGKIYRATGNFSISVRSSIDWFELHGEIDFDGASADLPALLAALKKGEAVVRLDDGSFGILPEEWLKKFGILAGAGKVYEDHLRFTRPQAGVLDALLSAQPQATCDATFERLRTELQQFSTITHVKPPRTFVGELRPYQQEGLGWLDFLRRFGFGGCLADDMGLGKTIQVLAMLEARREARANGDRKSAGPSLVVVPRSLVFNWKLESEHFTPKLRILDHTGAARGKATQKNFKDYDVVLTTYGTLRSDALHLKEIGFDYVILDEAQAIKNSSTASAKAARLMQGRHRLCMSGTPIENHLGELWSLFEFLNPGMLGTASVFEMGAERIPGEETRMLLSRALRPFILRRTKAQVAKDLPQKSEQTLYCELDSAQRELYNDLREHYRQALLSRVLREGVNKSKIQILEALLRLRQAACHPGLIDKSRTSESSAKLETLLPQLLEVQEEGHKVLVFSQFTSMLAILRAKLDAEKITYEYLDGKTSDREAKVNRFQSDPDCKLFLISLKAGGLGLNLTAAEYVFLLDPWWNPAVEAQAIDRAHRIGQTRPVFAYRLIARDTVEEKVLQLQNTKRALADAIINADNSLIKNLTREDLELLLG